MDIKTFSIKNNKRKISIVGYIITLLNNRSDDNIKKLGFI